VRLTAAAVSGFYSFLEQETEGRVRNPVRGTRARPRSSQIPTLEVPSPEAVAALLARLEGNSVLQGGAAAVIAFRGLRVGALPAFTVKGSQFRTISKGKELLGELPETALGILKAEGLSLLAPFAGLSAQKLAECFRYWAKEFYREDLLEVAYSVRDLRYYFAVTEYRKDRDLYRVSRLLGHASIQITEIYLRSLGEIG
jgi:integrase